MTDKDAYAMTDQDDEDAVRLVVEILDARRAGDSDTLHGNGDEDLLAAIEEALPALARITARLGSSVRGSAAALRRKGAS